ncbi:thiamine pyrophosphate-dependent enzyme [Breznakiella homolactica]|uniref:Glyoxylate carboligase n=1 Tax=Breznakiella homolactica TaxID=2798577 RepID=A0A7T7XM63_9SPIR|nr:thiamine pyrophosphate-dependent enzyme [Breznakiella homolactica]QQO08890.1 glyoxylate carboligase [Breznakiella homolactica]
MQIAQVIVEILKKEGITDAFGIPGAGINPVYKYLKETPEIHHYLMRHEEAAVHAADAYYRASGKMALAICTSGPGATNFVTGIYTAWIDSVPLIAITGQGNSSQLGKGAFQCVDIAAIVKPVCKKSYCVLDASRIAETLREAFAEARSGRPGPVLIDLPLDIQMADIEFNIADYTPVVPGKAKPDQQLIKKAVSLLDAAENPVIVMGGGTVSAGAEKQLLEFAEFMNIPVITTYMAKGGLPEAHPLNAGQMGIQAGASSSGNQIFLESDVVLGVGCRFTDRHTGALGVYKGDRRFIHIDIDPNEIGKLIEPEVGIAADAAEAVPALLQEARSTGSARKGSPRVGAIPLRKKNAERKWNNAGEVIDPRDVFGYINSVFNDETYFTTGCGLNQIWSGQYQKINRPRKYLPSGGAGTLGFDIPAAIGASVGAGKQKAVCIMGDFGFTFLVEELAVAAKYELPIVVIILNNAYLSLIRQNQKYAYKYEYEVAMKENKDFINYIQVAQGLGCQAERVFTYEEIQPALERAAAAAKPYVVEIIVEDATDCNMGNDIAHINMFA